MALWSSARELMRGGESPFEGRKSGLGWDSIRESIHRPGMTSVERRQLFEIISAPCKPEEFRTQFAALAELTNHAKDVTTFEPDIMPLIASWLNYWFKAAAAARKTHKEKEKEKGVKAQGVLVEESCLNRIYDYAVDLVRFSFNAFQEQDVTTLLEQLLHICKRTTVGSDIKSALKIIDALVTYGEIPLPMLDPCLDVFCGAYGTVKDLVGPIWTTVSNLCKCHTAQNTVNVLLDILRSPSGHGNRNTNTLRGAVLILKRLWTANGADGLAVVTATRLLETFELALAANSARLELEVVEAVLELLQESSFIGALTEEDDWRTLVNILAQCSRKASEMKRLHSRQSTDRAMKNQDMSAKISDVLNKVILCLEKHCSQGESEPKQTIMEFFMAVSGRLPNTSAELLVKHYVDEHLCYPSNAGWLVDSKQLIKAFVSDQTRPASVRLQVLQEVYKVYQLVEGQFETALIRDLIEPVFQLFPDETDGEVLESLKGFILEVAARPDGQLSEMVFAVLGSCIPVDFALSSMTNAGGAEAASAAGKWTATSHSSSLATEAAVSTLTSIFIRSSRSCPSRAKESFDLILRAAHSRECDSGARIVAMRLLFRLRSDAVYRIYLADMFESETLAATLGRTAESRDALRKNQDMQRNRQSRQDFKPAAQATRSPPVAPQLTSHSISSRSSVVTLRSARRHTPWVYQEECATPEEPGGDNVSLVSSRLATTSKSDQASAVEAGRVLDVKLWLESLISILQQEDDWDVYSYVLVHLASQLTNHSLFVDAVLQIQMLRNVLCEQLRTASFREPPISTGLKKSDVMVCLFHTLAILLTYHHAFSKNEQDEIVRTFLAGVGSGEPTAKYCIHALALCCHELPLSVSKSLNNILQKMSQIITQSQVAIHILEFLAGLARLPEVYVNFRDEDYRTVFGVCFRYLQYVRDQRERAADPALTRSSVGQESQVRAKRESGLTAEAGPVSSAAHDLPQYVYALAYHVITFWFLSVKIVDRPKYTSWITKNLVLTDSTGREVIDEQSQVTIDMMQRVAFSDHDETLPDTRFVGSPEELILKKSWLVGMSILTIETGARSGTSQITKRQPSATTQWTHHSKIAPRPLHQTPISSQTMTDTHEEGSRIEVLPNHVLLQLMSSSWRTPASMRPIPLPDDDATHRAISMFDRNSTVDGHKVGVIYIAQGQTTEAEILANAYGSDDFTDLLTELGTLIKLKGAKFNTQGLDRETDGDGEFTFCWRDRVTEIVFHIPVMMPTDQERDPHCVNKKRHTGNDFVNIIFNNSGLPFRFDTFPSEFNYVNIVIAPEARSPPGSAAPPIRTELHRRFYKVQVMSKPGFPQISPAAETKVLSGKSLPAFVRLIALHASVFCLVWANREGGEHISSWRNRLREINRLRDKHSPGMQSYSNATSPGPAPSSAGGMSSRDTGAQRESVGFRRTSGPGFFGGGGGGGVDGIASQRSSIFSTATTATETDAGGFFDGESLADGYDFSKWAS